MKRFCFVTGNRKEFNVSKAKSNRKSLVLEFVIMAAHELQHGKYSKAELVGIALQYGASANINEIEVDTVLGSKVSELLGFKQ